MFLRSCSELFFRIVGASSYEIRGDGEVRGSLEIMNSMKKSAALLLSCYVNT